MPSSFSRVLSSALVYSTRPPVSVCGTVLSSYYLEAFLGSTSDDFFSRGESMFRLEDSRADLPTLLLLSQTGISNTRIIFHTPSPHRLLDNGLGILTLFPSTTLLSLALGADSPCSDERRAGNLGLTASGLFTRFNVTHVSIRTSDTSSMLLNTPSQAYRTLPYHSYLRMNPRLRLFA